MVNRSKGIGQDKGQPEGKTIKLHYPEDMVHLPMSPVSGSRSDEFTMVLSNQIVAAMRLKANDLADADRQIVAGLTAMMGIKTSPTEPNVRRTRFLLKYIACAHFDRFSIGRPTQCPPDRSEALRCPQKPAQTAQKSLLRALRPPAP